MTERTEPTAEYRASRNTLMASIQGVQEYLAKLIYGNEATLSEVNLEELFFNDDDQAAREHYRSQGVSPIALAYVDLQPEAHRAAFARHIRQKCANLVIRNMVAGTKMREETFPLVMETVFEAKKDIDGDDYVRRMHIKQVKTELTGLRTESIAIGDNATVGRADTALSLLPDVPRPTDSEAWQPPDN